MAGQRGCNGFVTDPGAIDRHLDRFRERFGTEEGVRLYFSPGRVNLMGAHLDYNGGPVMPMAIDRGTFLAVRPRGDDEIRLASLLEPSGIQAPLAGLPDRASGRWYDYPVGVIRHLAQNACNTGGACGVDVLYGGNLAIGAGLSSSASICVGTAFALDRTWGLEGSAADWVEAALWGEREFVGVRCGIMDPFAVAFARPGHLLWVDCKDARTEHLPLDGEAVAVAVADTGIRRDLAAGTFNQRVEECARAFALLREDAPGATCLRDVPLEALERRAADLDPVLLRRARHVVAEVGRTFAARDALLRGDLGAFGEAITASHRSLRDHFDVSVPELDCLVDAALGWDGVLGTRLTGAGFGGCTVALLRREACDGFAEHLEAAFRGRFGRRPKVAFYGGDGGPREIG